MNTGLLSGVQAAGLNVAQVRQDFPILATRVHDKALVYLDNAATTQKPMAVIDSISRFYREAYSSVHRGVHHLSGVATQRYESARRTVQTFINAAEPAEIVFVRGATEAINLVAQSWGRSVRARDEILITAMEHHSNIVPWQMLCEQAGALLRVVPITDQGELRMDRLVAMLNERTRMLAVTHVSNALGTINPVQELVALAHARGIPVLVDGAQAAPHQRIDVRALGCDFYTFSGHKLYGPTGIGVLYGKRALLERMPPWHGGGDMILRVTFEKTTYNALPYKFEAGTPNLEGAVGLQAAIEYLQSKGLDLIEAHEQELLRYASEVLVQVKGVTLVGTARRRGALVSFTLDGVHPHDVGTLLDREGVAVRAGHHCAMPVMERFQVPATVRASFAMYNTRSEIDVMAEALDKARRVFQRG